MQIQWYPGHMTKTVRAMQEDIRLVDMLIELRDARIPLSSKNPDIEKLAGNKPRVILLNKCDLADENETRRWIDYFTAEGIRVQAINAREKRDIQKTKQLIEEAGKEKRERDKKRGILNRPFRIMVVGIPNIGKSTFINSFAGKAMAKTGDKPGVTRGKQWIRIGKTAELLDTPGILWPKFEDRTVGVHLALTGAIRDEVLPTEELASDLITLLSEQYPNAICDRYGIEADEDVNKVMNDIASAKSLIKAGGENDISRAAAMLIDDMRSGRLGRITIEQTKDGK